MEEIRFIDLFSGIGGFRLGLEKAGGFKCVWSCDKDRDANNIYYRRFKPRKGEHYPSDIKGIDPRDIPDHRLLCAGFPCPSFSMAGPRTGFNDQRGEVFFEIPRIAEIKRPEMLFLENVPGILSHDRGRTFGIILDSLEELGYWVEWQILNSKFFGVPQNRERVFLIGHLGGKGRTTIFPIEKGDRISKESWREKPFTNQLATPVTQNLKRGVHSGGETLIKVGNIAKSGHDSLWGRVYDPDGLAANLNAEGGGLGAKTGLYAVLADNLGENIKDRIRPVEKTQIAGLMGESDFRIRRLTPVECERLQGFPDGWTEGLSDNSRYKCIGKAVTVNVIEYMGKLIHKYFYTSSYSSSYGKDIGKRVSA